MRAATDQYNAAGLLVDDTDVPPRWMCRCIQCGDMFESNADDPGDTCRECEAAVICPGCRTTGTTAEGICYRCGYGAAYGGD